jgi:hypothetical protein
VLLAGAALVLLVGWAAILLLTGGHQGDVAIYEGYARRWLDGAVPYRDFPVEYPPLSLAVMVWPALLPGAYADWYGVEMALVALATAALTLRVADHVGADRTRVAVAFVAGLLALSVHPPRHLDLAPTCSTVAAILLFLRGRAGWAGATLAGGALLKVFPVVIAPAAVVWLTRTGGRRAVLRAAAAFALVAALGAGAAAAASADGAMDMVRYHLDRPAQVGSSTALLLRLGDGLGIGEAHAESSFGSDNVVGSGGDALVALGAAAFAAVVLLFTGRLLRASPLDPWRFVAACFGAVATFIVFGKVLSPQFLIWLLPLLGLLAGRGAWRACALLLAAMLVTTFETGETYFRLADGDPLGVAVAGLRIVLVVGVLIELWREVGAASHPG